MEEKIFQQPQEAQAAQHYTFDARAQGLSGLGTGNGEVWVATDGGTVLKYSASFEGGEEYFGEGVTGTITWEYELHDIDQPLQLDLPTACPFGRVDAPLMADATNVDEEPGVTTYITTSTMEAVINFYEEQMTTSGWEVDNEPTISEDGSAVTFVQGENQLTIVVYKTEDGISVWLLMEEKLEPMPGG